LEYFCFLLQKLYLTRFILFKFYWLFFEKILKEKLDKFYSFYRKENLKIKLGELANSRVDFWLKRFETLNHLFKRNLKLKNFYRKL